MCARHFYVSMEEQNRFIVIPALSVFFVVLYLFFFRVVQYKFYSRFKFLFVGGGGAILPPPPLPENKEKGEKMPKCSPH